MLCLLQTMKHVLVAFDLDHTLISKNSDTYILRLLPDGAQLPQSIKKLYSSAGWNDYMREVFRYLHSCRVSKQQLLGCVAEIPLVEGMRQLLEYLDASKTMAIRTAETSDSCVRGRRGVADDAHVTHSHSDVTATLQHQHPMTTVATGPAVTLATFPRSAADSGPHSNQSDSPVQFDVIIISDSNSVSRSQSL